MPCSSSRATCPSRSTSVPLKTYVASALERGGRKTLLRPDSNSFKLSCPSRSRSSLSRASFAVRFCMRFFSSRSCIPPPLTRARILARCSGCRRSRRLTASAISWADLLKWKCPSACAPKYSFADTFPSKSASKPSNAYSASSFVRFARVFSVSNSFESRRPSLSWSASRNDEKMVASKVLNACCTPPKSALFQGLVQGRPQNADTDSTTLTANIERQTREPPGREPLFGRASGRPCSNSVPDAVGRGA
mmetsp:Transcript_70548/g.202107  ORF Transcript_70548/g.202107 Transcript_70548/m.202107 type:complete len:249 (-) Transcript_70548:81-827(-)